MGTSGAYGGSGGQDGRDVAAGVGDWLDELPTDGGNGGQSDDSSSADDGDVKDPVELPSRLVRGVLGLIRPPSGSGAGGDGPGGSGTTSGGAGGAGGSGGGARRSSAKMAGSAGRAAAVAYAYASADRDGLAEYGLSYEALRSLNDPIEVIRQIVEAACGPRADSSLEEHEERYVAATVAEWVLEHAEADGLPPPEEITRCAIAAIMFEVILTEMGEKPLDRPNSVVNVAEEELKDAAEVLSDKAKLSADGATAAEISRAIEGGLNSLRKIYAVGT